MTKSGLIRTFRQQNPASTEFLVLNPLKLRNSIPPCQICTPNDALSGDKLFEDGWVLCIHHYVATSAAAVAIKERLDLSADSGDFPVEWARSAYPSFGMVLQRDLPIDAVDGRHDGFLELTRIYYDPKIRTKHTDVGGVAHLGLGYGGCALPLVLEHNTPNNAIALLWAETDGGVRDGVPAPAMWPLFRRRQRHG